MKQTRKAELVASQLVTLVVISVSLIVLLIVYAGFNSVLKAETLQRECQWNLMQNAFTKNPITGGEAIPPDCEMLRVNLSKKQLEKKISTSKKEIIDFDTKYYENKYTSFNIDKNQDMLEYELDRIIANEIKSCWEVAWMGQMPIFKEWWDLFTCYGDERVCKCKTKDCGNIGKAIDISNSAAPAFCLICSRIKFDDEIQTEFESKIISTLPEWMKNHEVITDAKSRSYYEYVMDDDNIGIFAPEYKYQVNEPLAVVYGRVNVLRPQQAIEGIGNFVGILDETSKAQNFLGLIPYSEVSNKCTYIIG
jgi:hypothetical protein